MNPNNFKTPIKVIVKSPEEELFNGFVQALTSKNSKGVFDVLPLHGNFISILNQTIVLHLKDQQPKEIKIDSAVLRNVENTVFIFLGIDTLTPQVEVPDSTI